MELPSLLLSLKQQINVRYKGRSASDNKKMKKAMLRIRRKSSNHYTADETAVDRPASVLPDFIAVGKSGASRRKKSVDLTFVGYNPVSFLKHMVSGHRHDVSQ